MNKKPNQKTFRLSTIISGQLIAGTVAFSPAPEPGILTELARFEAQRILVHLVREEMEADFDSAAQVLSTTVAHWWYCLGASDNRFAPAHLRTTDIWLGADEIKSWC
jgi:hypothetical protein